MSKCEHISKKTNLLCGTPCEINLKKPRCQKHGGEDLKTEESLEINPYKHASKEWLEWNKKMKKKSKKEDDTKNIETNPYLKYKGDVNIDSEFIPLCYLNEKYLLKGTPVYHYFDSRIYYICNNFKIELYEIKNFKKWGTIELEVVKNEYDIIDTKKYEKIFINQLYMKKSDIFDKNNLDLNSMTFRKYMKDLNNKKYLYFITDISTKINEKEKLIEIAGGYLPLIYSENFHNLDVKVEEKYSLEINLNNLSNDELNKIIQKKLEMRETYGDDYMYKEFLYKKYTIRKIGGPKYKNIENEEILGEKYLNEY
jgi:hypothetical protein